VLLKSVCSDAYYTISYGQDKKNGRKCWKWIQLKRRTKTHKDTDNFLIFFFFFFRRRFGASFEVNNRSMLYRDKKVVGDALCVFVRRFSQG
jgi:hypothetical protein